MGTAGVDLFFLLSGFLIYRSARRANFDYGDFLRRRAVRIYPAFLVMLIVYIALSLFLPNQGKPLGHGWDLFNSILLNLAFLPGLVDIKPIVTVAWSLSYEWYFYISLPLILRMCIWSHKKRGMRIALISTAATLYTTVSFLTPQLSNALHFPIYRFHVRLVMFLVGAIVCELLECSRLQTRLALLGSTRFAYATVAAGLLSLVLIEGLHGPLRGPSIFEPRFEALRCVVLVVMFVPTMLLALQQKGVHTPLLTIPELRWLGNISYSYYLVHTLPIDGLKLAISRFAVFRMAPLATLVVLFPLAFLATVGAATALFLLVERRFSLGPATIRVKAGSDSAQDAVMVA